MPAPGPGTTMRLSLLGRADISYIPKLGPHNILNPQYIFTQFRVMGKAVAVGFYKCGGVEVVLGVNYLRGPGITDIPELKASTGEGPIRGED